MTFITTIRIKKSRSFQNINTRWGNTIFVQYTSIIYLNTVPVVSQRKINISIASLSLSWKCPLEYTMGLYESKTNTAEGSHFCISIYFDKLAMYTYNRIRIFFPCGYQLTIRSIRIRILLRRLFYRLLQHGYIKWKLY